MKRTLLFLTIIASALFGLQSCDKDDEIVDPNKLPSKAETFIQTHFPSITVSSVIKDYDDFTHTYQVTLSDGTYIEFRKNGEWKEVENRVAGVPNSVVPEKILTYVTTNYPDNPIVDIEHDKHYDVELGSGIDLDFSSNGDFLRIDR